MRRLIGIWHLGVKELLSLRRDTVMLALIVWAFTLSIYSAATGISHDLRNAAIAIVDEDRSQLSGRIGEAFFPPYFHRPRLISAADIDPGMDTGRFTFVLAVPPDFQADVLAGRRPTIQLNIDATASMQAGIGEIYVSNIVLDEVNKFLESRKGGSTEPVRLVTRFAFNPNVESSWFMSVMELIENITMLSILLAGAALIREREHGTIEHLLVMPLNPFEIMMAKVWANALVVLVAATLSLGLVVQAALGVVIQGSIPLFLAGTALYLFFGTALGIFLATTARSMPQFGLLFILVILPMHLLSGGNTPLESQPPWLQAIMQAVPSTHYVGFAQAILYRGAGLDIVWPHFLIIAAMGGGVFALAAARFRRSITLV